MQIEGKKERILLGPGPSNVHSRVLRALSSPLLGHLDPDFINIMQETMSFLRLTFKTSNPLTIAFSGTGSAGMESCLVNLLEPGDRVVIGINGFFGERMREMALRAGAEVREVAAPWGSPLDPGDLTTALREKKTKLLAVVQGETSTGILQPLDELGRLAHEQGALILVDAAASLGGCLLETDFWELDACYSGSQKALSCPPGLAPATFNPRAEEAIRNRRHKVQSWYLDVSLIQDYWTSGRLYHHTAPVSMLFALREALRLVQEEGLEKRIQRHRENSQALRCGLAVLGLKGLSRDEAFFLPTIVPIRIPEGFDDGEVRGRLRKDWGIEIGGGLGELRGKIWRVGLMGEGSTRKNVRTILHSLADVLGKCGWPEKAEDALAVTDDFYRDLDDVAAKAG